MESECHISKQSDPGRLLSVLASAVSEWLLMFLLFLQALFSLLVTKFASFCNLQTPCLLCSRLDHVFGDRRPGFYWDLICTAHKSEISSLAYCLVHRKLVDVNEMCEGCLLSFATERKSNSETYRSLVGKLGVELSHNKLYGDDVEDRPLLNKQAASGSLATKRCSCCSMPFTNKSRAANLLQKDLVTVEDSELDVSLSHPMGNSHLHHKKREPSLGSPSAHHLGNHGFDRLSRVGYSEVKVTSDSESENILSEDDGEDRQAEDLKEDRCLNPEPAASVPDYLSMPPADDTVIEKLIHPASSEHEVSLLIPEDHQLHVDESRDVSLASTVATAHELAEINWKKTREQIDAPPALSENMSSNISDAKLNDSGNGNALDSTTTVVESSETKTSTNTNIITSQAVRDPVPLGPANMDLNDAYRLATGGKSSLPSPSVSEVISGKDSFKAYEGLRLLITQYSAARGLESPWNESSPSPRLLGDDYKFADASSSAILQNITKSLSIDRNESGMESLDGSIVSEIEGESSVERLKRQVELDRKSMYLLYKELEEERNASAIAANQAMIMITRLQEEKAAMQMEALQYQRMMEEQSEYDQGALQKLNELLAEREKDIQDLEAELERHRNQLNTVESSGDSHVVEIQKGNSDISEIPFLGFEEEKAYISERLKKLEKKLQLFSKKEDPHLQNGEYDEKHNGIVGDSNAKSHYAEDSNSDNLKALINEVSRLNERLKALEADRNFLEHTMNTLRNGDDGIQFVQDIACHLQELRRIGISLEKHTAV